MLKFPFRSLLRAFAASFAAILALASAFPPAAAQAPQVPLLHASPEEIARIDDLEAKIDAAFQTGDFVGLSVAVVRHGETVFLKSWGVRDVESGLPTTPDTVYRIASLSKAFAGTLAGAAIVEGKLAPETRIAPFAPGLSLAGGAQVKLTLADILSHRTGLPPNAYDNLLEEGFAPTAIYPKYRSVKLICPVGNCYAYQNIAFDIAGRALSHAYGAPYETLVEEKLFGPLGMTTASLGLAGLSASGDFARPHKRDRLGKGDDNFGPWRVIPVREAYYKAPAAGGVNASVRDMARWLAAQKGHAPNVVAKETLALIHAPRVVTPSETARMQPVSTRFRGAQYGLGWRVYAYEGAHLIAHAGTVDGYAAQIGFLPAQDVGIVILSNARSKRVWRILPTFLDIELGLSREDWLALNAADGLTPVAGSK